MNSVVPAVVGFNSPFVQLTHREKIMMNKQQLTSLLTDAGFVLWDEESGKPGGAVDWACDYDQEIQKLIELVAKQCINKLESYRIPVGNSSSGELACEWTYDALKEIRDDIREHFDIQ